MVPADAAARVTAELDIPTIGVGAGPDVSGQLLVWTDFAGLTPGRIPSFVKKYADLRGALTDAVSTFRTEVADGVYPGEEYSYH
jgi:3-methyl-2-oxobutanoate hydroxymethyltransferase